MTSVLKAAVDADGKIVGAIWIIHDARGVSPNLGVGGSLTAREEALRCRIAPLEVYEQFLEVLMPEDTPTMSLVEALAELGAVGLRYGRGRRPKKAIEEPKPKSKCPHPDKAQFRDRIAAELALAKIQTHGQARAKDPARAYRCRCGSWHLTSRK